MSLIVLVCVLLILVVLAQNSKGGGLTSQFGGSGASNMIGVKKTSDLLEKITWGLAISLCILAMSSKFIAESSRPSDGLTSPSIERAQEQSTIPTLDLGDSNSDADVATEGENLEDLTTEPEGTNEDSE